MEPRVRMGVAALSLFVLGAAAGMAFERGRGPDGLLPHDTARHHVRAMEHLRTELHLDEAQVLTIDSVVREHQIFVDRAWAELRPELQQAVDSVHATIESVLRPEQREGFRRFLERQGEGLHRMPP